MNRIAAVSTLLTAALLHCPANAYSAEQDREEIIKQAITAYSAACQPERLFEGARYPLKVQLGGDTKQRDYLLIEVPCTLAAYNTSQRWMLMDDYNEVRPIAFAWPEYRLTYRDPDAQTQLKSLKQLSYSARFEISNSSFDPETRTLSTGHKWRGLGDASSSGSWKLVGDRFVLLKVEIDPTYDGKINPVPVVDFTREEK